MTTEALNHRHWAPDRTGVYEVWYMTWNHAPTGQGFWLRYISEVPTTGAARAELWFARFDPRDPTRTFGVHRRLPPLQASTDPFAVTIDRSELGHDHARGELIGDGHAIEWDLRWEPADRVLRLLPDVMYARGGLGETTVQAPNPRVPMSGRLVVDGEALELDRVAFGQTHLWGTKHAYSWTWGRCADFHDAPDAVLELLAVRIQRRGRVLPRMTMVVLDLEGERHRLNQFRHVVRNRATWGGSHVAFQAIGARVKLAGELTCSPEQMVSAPYLDPDGTRVYCANTEIGHARVAISKRAGFGWREVRTLEGTAHFEIGGRERDPAVAREHVGVD